jgi:hypothetical protein
MSEEFYNLPVDMIFHFLVELNLYGKPRKDFAKRFKIGSNGTFNKSEQALLQNKIHEAKFHIEQNKDKYLLRLAKSPRLVVKYITHFRGGRLPEEAESLFFEKNKDSNEYFFYCSKFGIIVDNFEKIVTEIAMECDVPYEQTAYLDDILEQKENCKKFIEQFMKLKEINKNDPIESLLSVL